MNPKEQIRLWFDGAFFELPVDNQIALLYDLIDLMDREERCLDDALEVLGRRISAAEAVYPYSEGKRIAYERL